MKADTHPEYVEAVISCSCGNQVKTRGTVATLRVSLCSQCHPFYTGKRQLIAEKGGRIEQFHRRYGQRNSAAGKDAESAAQG